MAWLRCTCELPAASFRDVRPSDATGSKSSLLLHGQRQGPYLGEAEGSHLVIACAAREEQQGQARLGQVCGALDARAQPEAQLQLGQHEQRLAGQLEQRSGACRWTPQYWEQVEMLAVTVPTQAGAPCAAPYSCGVERQRRQDP